MASRLQAPFRIGVRVFGLAALVVLAMAGATAQEPAPLAPPPALPACEDLDKLGIPMQMNLRASAAMVACGRDVGGSEAQELGGGRPEATLIGGNVDVTPNA